MNSGQLPTSIDTCTDVTALIEALHRVGRRLDELTAGEVDTVADREGRTFLLHRAQEHLRQSEANKQVAILNALPAHIALLDNEGIIVAVNLAWQQFAASNALLESNSGIGANYLTVCDRALGQCSNEASQAAAGIRSILDGSAPRFLLEYPCHSPTEQRWFLMTVTPVAGDAPSGVVVMHVNISERKRAENELLRLAGAMNATADAIYLVDRDTMRFVHVNDSACRMLQQTREEVMACGPADALSVPLADLERVYDRIIASDEPSEPVEMFRTRKDGSQAWIELRRQAQRHEDGWLMVTMVRNITKRKKMSGELYESDRRFNDLMGNVDLISIVIDQHSRIIYCNDFFLRLTGWQREELLGEKFVDLIIPRDLADEVREVHTAMLADVPAARHHENEIVTRSGERRLIHWNNTVLRSEAGAAIGTASIGEDITDRKLAENALKASELQQRNLAEQLRQQQSRLVVAQRVAKIGSWETDLESMAVIWSSETHRIFETDELNFSPTHQGLLDMLHPEDRVQVETAFELSLGSRAANRMIEHRLLMPDGRIKFVEERWQVRLDKSEKPVTVVGTCQDITERKLKEIALRESEKKFHQLADNISDAFWVRSPDLSEVHYVSPAFEKIWGRPVESLRSNPAKWLDFIHAEDRVRVIAGYSLLRDKGENQDIEYRIVRPDGEIRWVRVRGFPVRDDAGTVIRLAGIVTDITERREVDQALRESERRFSDLLRNVGLASVMLDREGRITFCNDHLLRLTGWRYDEVIGLNWFDTFTPPEPGDIRPAFAALLADAPEAWRRESEIFTRSGKRHLIRWSNSVLRNATGEVIGSASIGEDITESRRAENEIRRLNADLERRVDKRTAELQAANQELEAFDYSVSHDLKAPIRHVDGFSTMLLVDYGDKLDAHGRSYVMRIQSAAKRMDQLVGDLLALSLISRGELHRTDVDLTVLAQQVFAMLRQAEPDRTIDFVVAPGIKVRADAGLLRIVLDNLFGNARKFTARRTDAKIEFGSALKDGTPTFFVRDNGAGFDEAYADKLFAPFQRLHAQSEFKGTGIGLATVRRIITRHSGKVWAEGAVDQGATIYFTLPS